MVWKTVESQGKVSEKSGNFEKDIEWQPCRGSFVKIKSSQNGEITLLFTDIVKSCPSREFLASKICYLMLFAKIKFSRKFLDLQ